MTKQMDEGESDPVVYRDCFCPLCSRKRNIFTCSRCITLGLFSNSRQLKSESYEEKRQRLESINKLKAKFSDRVLKSIQRNESADELRCNSLERHNRIVALHDAILLLKRKQSEDKGYLSNTTEENKKRRSRLDILKQQIKAQEKQLQTKTAKMQQKQSDLAEQQQKVVLLRRIFLDQTQKYIIPICKQNFFPEFGTPPEDTAVTVTHDACDVGLEVSKNCEKALSEATRTSYVEGKWLTDDDLENMQYKIFEATLPANGNYSPYANWLRSNKNTPNESVPTRDLKTSGLRITAGLSYACQLLDLIAFFLDVILPEDVHFSDFCLRDLTVSEFKSAVSRLNTNVLYLCLSQNISTHMLHPKRTLQNLYLSLDSSNINLGRFSAHALYDSLNYLPSDDDNMSSSDEEEPDGKVSHGNLELSSSDTEWETVTMDTPLSRDQQSVTMTSNPEQRQSTASSLVSSMTSLWPWKS